ncbi:hypothetical protein VTL71DRAFT_662 [Oculimacula yallundae]|uniref:Uncharacterized protein n=1 Tax=Oculimacula yallundae TaxID=86028 RepID=A0ABR4D0S6_9HELO
MPTSQSELLSSQDLPTLNESSPSSSTLLRFPVPATDERVGLWVESTSSAKMSARSDEGILGESAYEFIDTDEESRDDNATESVASTDYERPDDVASLADTEGDDSGDEDNPNTSPDPALPGLEHAVEQAFNTPTIGRSSTVVLDDLDKPFSESIEFEEPYNLGTETVSVKHTITNLNEEQTTNALKGMALHDQPKRVVVAIRQTMTKQGLSTRDPLRILYIGSHSAKQDIIHKIASSVTASVEGDKHAQRLRQSTSQLYNVVPVSAFGSERTPEIELMHSSGYQIKVEDCTFAQNLKFEDVPEKPDVIKLTLDDNFAYHSVPDGEGFIVEPHWDLPHVAIFYCSDADDILARRTRTIARKFMNRHAIPSIVISHKQLFERGQCMSLDQHSIHMCLESRDPNGRGNIIHQRLPIDLASFLNIDARQMNRNLAYLTGLHEPLDTSSPQSVLKKTNPSLANAQDVEKTSYGIADSVNFIRNRNGAALWRAILPVGMLLLSVFLAVFTGIPSYRFSRVTSAPAISVNSKIVPAISISSTASLTSAAPPSSITSVPTSSSAKTSVQTITVTQSIALAPGPNSLSVLPSMEIGKVPTPAPSSKSFNKSYVCTAELLGDREILIRIPSATKLSWLAKEAMSVNITRNNVTVDTERAYSSDEGIILLLPKKDAYGVLNISIITTKKPRVNETFQVDFGSTASWQAFLSKLSSMLPQDAILDSQLFSRLYEPAEHVAEDTLQQLQSALRRIEDAKKAAIGHAVTASEGFTGAAKSLSHEAAKRSVILGREVGIQLAEISATVSKKIVSAQNIREPLDEGLIKAQIQSKLLWLKLQGKHAEYQEYQRRASKLTRDKTDQSQKFSKPAGSEKKKADRLAHKAAKKAARKAGKKVRA